MKHESIDNKLVVGESPLFSQKKKTQGMNLSPQGMNLSPMKYWLPEKQWDRNQNSEKKKMFRTVFDCGSCVVVVIPLCVDLGDGSSSKKSKIG